MAAFLARDLATIALCWRLERRDGIAIGFTTHDRDLELDGIVYRAAPGMLPSAISLSDGFEPDTLDVEGALTAAAIRADDLADGRWDGAALTVFMTDWEAPGETLAVARGELGEVVVRGNAFEAELRGPTALLDGAVVEQTSPECRAALGDERCRVDMAGRVRITRIAAVPAEDEIEVESASLEANAYSYGRLRWLGGANQGLESEIVASSGTALTLREAPPRSPEPGDLIELREGCDKSLATCSGRFGNAANFRGEPHLPGMDLLTRYPGA